MTEFDFSQLKFALNEQGVPEAMHEFGNGFTIMVHQTENNLYSFRVLDNYGRYRDVSLVDMRHDWCNAADITAFGRQIQDLPANSRLVRGREIEMAIRDIDDLVNGHRFSGRAEEIAKAVERLAALWREYRYGRRDDVL